MSVAVIPAQKNARQTNHLSDACLGRLVNNRQSERIGSLIPLGLLRPTVLTGMDCADVPVREPGASARGG